MNIFSNVEHQNSQDKDNDAKEKARRMENHTVELREKKRLDILRKNRNIDKSNQGSEQSQQERGGLTHQYQALMSLEPEFRAKIEQIYKITFKFEQIGELVIALNSQDVLFQHHGCIGLRKLLSIEDSPPIQIAIDSNCVPRFIEFIKQSTYPVLQLEASWCLTNIASGTTHQTQSIIDKGAIPLFCKLLLSPFQDIAEQAIWAIGNISGDCSVYRDMILKCDGLKPLVNILLNTNDRKTIKHGSWALSNLCRGRPLPDYNLVQEAVKPLCKVLTQETDSEVLTDSSWAISYLSDGDEDRIQRIIDTGVIPTLIRLINHQYLSVLIPCLRTLGNVCTGTDEQTEEVLKYNALPEIFKLVKHQKKAVRREACWVLSNIAAGNERQISQIVNQPQYVQWLFECMIQDSDEIAREATWVISNCTSQANPQDIRKLVEMNVLKIYTDILKSTKDVKTIAVILESLKHILECGKNNFMQGNDNPFCIQLEQFGALDFIEELQRHPDDDVYRRSLAILENYFDLEDEQVIRPE
ncbi:importin subunit alpha (macronuclear) [Tetrahymena thermophila SB210]|uniref:Importin subunit alpha n=1 Tax=Tetrahymena thermophila (strain SB210) TaxID=312017 RepID=Q22CR9_TETTS|nr:importin subunit alpha [Tetrahymena thermophila SB210]EAR83119.1 importin subunit alpha [Tetrahymena thermophila SB210]|eukprot:XP_001030782.1 importin subunit alpha [Tetrahymena thermophila SB210]